jgi:hypothetical protein
MSSVRTKRQKKDATTPVEPPHAPVIATPYNMEKEAAVDADGRRRQRQRRWASVECDPSCRMAAAFLGAQCECETLIVFFFTCKQGWYPAKPSGDFRGTILGSETQIS